MYGDVVWLNEVIKRLSMRVREPLDPRERAPTSTVSLPTTVLEEGCTIDRIESKGLNFDPEVCHRWRLERVVPGRHVLCEMLAAMPTAKG
jgi:hypothetical protein